MKRYLLSLIACVCVSIGAWAQTTSGTFGTDNLSSWEVADEGKTLTVTFASLADWGDACGTWTGQFLWSEHEATIKKVVIKTTDNTVSFSGVNDKMYKFSQAMTNVTTIDLSNLTSTNISYLTTGTNLEDYKVYNELENLILPAGVDLGTGVSSRYNLFTQSGSVLNATFNRGVSDVDWEMVNDGCTTLKLTGNISSAINLGDVTGFTTIDLSDATISANISLNEDVVTAVKVASADVKNFVKEKDGTTAFDSSKIEVPFSASQTVTGGSIQSQLETYLADYAPAKTVADITSLVVTGTISSADVTYLSSLTGLETLDLSGASYGTGVTKAAIASAVSTETTVLYPASFAVSGCNVTIDMARSGGTDISTLLSEAKAAVVAGGQQGICTLTVSGELSSNDITVGLSSSAMDGATRIDLSGATLASGVILTSLNIPSSLTSLVLPKGQTVSSGLASKLTAATSLEYAYSPTSSSSRTVAEQFSPDYVYVKIPGSLSTAVSNEEGLRKGVYIKIATPSGVNLSDNDAKFGTMGIDVTDATNYGWQYVDMSDAGVTAEATLAATAPHDKGYRIILPDNLTGDNMAIFASNTNHGNIAALYSYSGTTLRILEITDGSYKESALHDSRIVFPGTDAIEIVSGSYNDTKYGTFGEPNSQTNNLLAAINNAASSIKSVTISDVTTDTDEPLTFTNTNLTTIQLDRVKSAYDTEWNIAGPIINVNSCTSLQTLNLINCQLKSVTAQNSSITSITLNGTGVNGDTNLSGSGLKTLTTNSDTWIQGDLHLESTASFTSFASTAKFGVNNATNGNIYLNASGVSTVDLQRVQFQNNSSKIHIHKTANEEDTNVLDALNAAGQLTIYIPTGFDKANRLHPYPMDGETAVLADNIAELAGTGSFEDTCNPKCHIDYNAETHVATVYCYTPGHFKALMEKDNNYGKFVDGAIFTFDASCKLNAADLAALAGKDGYGNFNWNYVDLYNLPASYEDGGTTVNYEDVITGAIDILRTNDWQYKGLLLPKNPTTVGTRLIIDSEVATTSVPTCSQFIAYQNSALTTAHIYKAANDWGISYEDRFAELENMLNRHSTIASETTTYTVSTNDAQPIDISDLRELKTSIEVFNNEMVKPTNQSASIYVYPKTAGDFTSAVQASNLGNTPTELLRIEGPVSTNVITALNKFTAGPRVLDLRQAVVKTGDDEVGFSKEMLTGLTNDNIEYILLPEGLTKDIVCGADYSDLDNLKAVISSSATNLVAHVQQPGSLAQARYYATGGAIDGTTYTPTVTGLQSVTLSGFLDASDILANTTTHFVNEQGHWIANGSNAKSVALNQEQGTITTIDLKDAVFPTQEDMNFSYAGLSSLKNVTLPTSPSMTLICDECFMGIASLTEICVPYNYKKFGDAAFHNSSLDHLTTTDVNGALIDNGPKTFTFSKNVEEIGNKPETADKNGVHSLSRNVFAHNTGVTDVYVLAHMVPKCYANAFPANMLYGWGGFKGGDFPYCREKYDNSSDGSMIFTVLHFPDEASFNASTDREESYTRMKALYTDITKIYTKKEQTGAVDANGDAIAWPTFSETRRVYNQATNGIIWDDWKASYDINHEVNGAFPLGLGKNAVDAATVGGEGQDANHNPLIQVKDEGYGFTDYEGWHQFVLSMATYVEPDKTVVNDVIKNYYVKGPWYTLCIPFSLTVDQACEMLGVPASVEGVEENYLDGEKIIDNTRKLPDVRTLQTVTRKPGKQNEVTLKFTQDLVTADVCRYWYINDSNPIRSDYGGTGYNKDGERIAIVGGYPYLVQPYLPQGVVVKNLGKYIMTKFASDFKQELSCIYVDGCAQDLAAYSEDNKTGRFAKPFEHHKIQAALDVDGDNITDKYDVHADKTKYYYTFVGQFWDQPLPQYAFYMVETNDPTNEATTKNSVRPTWYRYTSGTKNYKWNKYKCVIMATQEVSSSVVGRSYLFVNSGLYRNNEDGYSMYPASTGTDSDGGYKFDKSQSLYIEFLNGRDDAIFDETASARYVIEFDDAGVQEIVDDDNAATAISSLDGEDIMPTGKSLKVYNVAGQYVGQSLDGLAKGMYIVNGKKVLVK